MAEELHIPAAWLAWHRWARLAPASAMFVFSLPAAQWKASLALAYLVLALLAAWTLRGRRLAPARSAWLADWAALLLCAGLGRGEVPATLLFLYLCGSALWLRSSLEAAAVPAAALPAWFWLRPDTAATLGPAFAIGAVLTVAGCRLRETLLATMTELAARERDRIAGDFHDGPLQSFSNFQIRLELIRKLLERDPAAAAAELHRLQELGKAQSRELREFLAGLRGAPEGNDLRAGLRRLIEQFEREAELPVSVQGLEAVPWEGLQAGPELLKMVREALHNVHKHARASRVELAFTHSGTTFEITVRDDGVGFPFAGAYGLEELETLRLGPESIKRRVRALGGELRLESRPGAGAELRIRVPA